MTYSHFKQIVATLTTMFAIGFAFGQESPDATDDQIATWIEQLGSPKYRVRELATNQLLNASEVAAPALQAAANDEDKERATRAKKVLLTADLKSIHGTWKYVSIKFSGKDEPVGGTLIVRDGVMTIRKGNGSEPYGNMPFAINPVGIPKQLDFMYTDQRTKKTAPIRCLYSLAGDTLTLCYSGESNAARPKKIGTRKEDGLRLHVLKRVEPESEELVTPAQPGDG